MRAIDIYRGKFLPKSGHIAWVVPLATYYHGLYLRCIKHVINILKHQNRNQEIISVCERALLIDQFEECLYEELVRSLIATGNQSRAITCYQQATDLFYRELGVRLSSNLRNLYREIIKTLNSVETDLGVIKEDLRESNREQGAFFCEYEILRNIYRLEARSASRTGQAVFVVLLTVTPAFGDSLPTKLINTSMKKLRDAINRSLRRGDVVSRFSATQYMVMLSSLTFENGQMIISGSTKTSLNFARIPEY
jgi:tetratricopeptide (TPR) repeat protein